MQAEQELIEAFESAVTKGVNDPRPFNFDQINVCFMNKQIHVFNLKGDTPYGRFALPPNKNGLNAFLEKMNAKVTELEDNNEYLCYQCGKQHDLPAAAKKDGAPICHDCNGSSDSASIGEIINGKKKEKEKDAVDAVNTPTKEALDKEARQTDSAIAFLQKRGFVVKRLIPSYRVAYLDVHKTAQVTDEYFKSEEEFKTKYKAGTFLQLILALKQEEEVIEL